MFLCWDCYYWVCACYNWLWKWFLQNEIGLSRGSVFWKEKKACAPWLGSSSCLHETIHFLISKSNWLVIYAFFSIFHVLSWPFLLFPYFLLVCYCIMQFQVHDIVWLLYFVFSFYSRLMDPLTTDLRNMNSLAKVWIYLCRFTVLLVTYKYGCICMLSYEICLKSIDFLTVRKWD